MNSTFQQKTRMYHVRNTRLVYILYTSPSKHNFKLLQQGHSCTLKYSSTLIYTHVLLVHSCTTPSRNPGPTRMLMSHGGTSHGSHEKSRAVTWMSHCSHEPDVDESQREQAWPLVQYVGCKQTLFALGQHAGSPYLCGTRCVVQNCVSELLNVPRSHLATCQAQAVPTAHISPRYAGMSTIGNNGKISQLLPISTNYCLLLPISTYYRPTRKGDISAWLMPPFRVGT